MPNAEVAWWREGVIYQIYVRSFADTNGDGIGDLAGVIDHLDHLAWLGVDGIWLSPITPSPDRDWGYDVSDYVDVHPDLGDLATLDRLVSDAGRKGIRVVVDLVPNHTSDLHPWFVESRSSTDAAHRDWYVWRDRGPDGSAPNNWVSVFGGSAWEVDETTGQDYFHNFLREQPDLDWWNEDVRREFERILRFWFDRGIAGFRIDVANGLIKDRALRDNPPADDDDPPEVRRLGLRPVHNMNRPEVHEIYRAWRAIADSFDPHRVLIGETWIFDPQEIARYYGEAAARELDLCFNFPFIFADFEASELRGIVEAAEAALAPTAQPTWAASNHDVGRFPTRWCADRPDATRCALMTLLTLRGTPFLYYGDEIGMAEVPVADDEVLDPAGSGGTQRGRDPGRTPMQWNPDPGAGFTGASTRPWLPIGDARAINVRDQRSDPDSMLTLCRDLIALRRTTPDLRAGAYASLPSPPGTWTWRRGDDTIVSVNLSDEPVRVRIERATIAIGTRRARDDEPVEGALSLGAWEGAVVRVAPA